MDLTSATALVTGANRGLGRRLAEQLRDRGATVFAAARHPERIETPGVIPVRIDVTDQATIDAAVAELSPISLLVNNAGSATGAGLLTGDLADVRTELDTHFFGSLAMIRAFAPGMADQPESAILNVLSVLSWLSIPRIGGYCAAKSAAWSMTNAVRQELAAQGTVVTALHVGYMDTDMARGVEGAKSDPADIARLALDAVAAGEYEVIADDVSAAVRGQLPAGVAGLYPALATAG